jgi:PAS domain S-box-containing protein
MMATPTLADALGYNYTRAIVESMRKPLVVLAPDLRVLAANLPFYRMFRMEPEQVQGRLLYELGSGQWESRPLRELLTTAFAGDDPLAGLELTAEFEHLGRITLLLDARRLPVSEEPRAVMLTMEDVTERKRIEAALAASETRYRRLFEAAQDGILLLARIIHDRSPAGGFRVGCRVLLRRGRICSRRTASRGLIGLQ